MRWVIPLGRIAGIPIGVNWTWLPIVALVIANYASDVFPSQNPGLSDTTYLVMAAALALLFFAGLLLHELGHALVAKRQGMQIEGITLWLLGGVARILGEFPSPGAEFRVAVAGPAVSFVIGATFAAVAWLAPLPDAVDGVVVWMGDQQPVPAGVQPDPGIPAGRRADPARRAVAVPARSRIGHPGVGRDRPRIRAGHDRAGRRGRGVRPRPGAGLVVGGGPVPRDGGRRRGPHASTCERCWTG